MMIPTLAFWLFFWGVVAAEEMKAPDFLEEMAAPDFVIAVVKDGESWHFNRMQERVAEELKSLSGEKYGFEFRVLDAGHRTERVLELLGEAMADPEVDLVYCSGVVATEMARKLPEAERTKPVMAGAVQFSALGLLISPEGTSSVPRYTFITEPKRVEADLALLKRLSGETTLHIPIDRNIFEVFDRLEENRTAMEEAFGVSIKVYPVEPDVEGIVEDLAGAKAVYVPLMHRLTEEERTSLYRKLAEGGAITVAMSGVSEVELGALAGQAPDDQSAVARRTALNIHQMLQGVSTENLPVYLPVQDQLLINAETAQLADWSPTYELALEADYLKEEILFEGRSISLDEAMRRALEENAEVIVAVEEQRIQEEQQKIAGSALWPQASLEASGNHTEFSDRFDPMAPAYTQGTSYGVRLRQVLFNDEISAQARAQRHTALAAALDRLSQELDAMDAAASAYFDVLTARALYQIERENLRLTQNNLQLARLRVEIGSAEPSEVFRWEQDAARAKAALIQRETNRSNAVLGFNRVIGAPRQTQWNFADIELADDDFYFMNEELKSLETQDDFQKFGDFLRWMAVENSPELASFDYALGAQGEILRQKQRQFYVPEVALVANADRVGSETDAMSRDEESQLGVGLTLSFPLFEGGSRRADVRKQKATIRQLEARRENAVQQIEQRVMTAFNNLGAAHPNILFSREALRSAEKNYEAVRNKYSQGAATVLDLLDAQSALVGQRQQAATAVYSYLAQVHAMQRSIAWFEFSKTAAERAEFQRVVQQFMSGAVSETPPESSNENKTP